MYAFRYMMCINNISYTIRTWQRSWPKNERMLFAAVRFRGLPSFPFGRRVITIIKKLFFFFFLFFSFFCSGPTLAVCSRGRGCCSGPAVFDEGYNIIYRFPFTVYDREHCLPGPEEPSKIPTILPT